MTSNIAVGTVVDDDGDLKIMTNNGLQSITANTVSVGAGISNAVLTTPNMGNVWAGNVNTIAAVVNPDDMLEKYEFNQFVVEHKVQEQELMKLKETNVNYAEEIKEAMAKNCAREFIKKLSFSKKHDPDANTHSFRGRVWVFTREELVNLIEDVKQGRV